jgi:Stress responsive A/B Barrel Domain
MKRTLSLTLVLAVFAAAGLYAFAPKEEKKVMNEGNLGHMVYFTLKDNSSEAKAKLVAACKKYLTGHDGTVYFSAGVLAEDFKRDVNDREFDVALHLVFKDKAAHDKYQDHPRHEEFIKENKDNWKKVRVFDSVVK